MKPLPREAPPRPQPAYRRGLNSPLCAWPSINPRPSTWIARRINQTDRCGKSGARWAFETGSEIGYAGAVILDKDGSLGGAPGSCVIIDNGIASSTKMPRCNSKFLAAPLSSQASSRRKCSGTTLVTEWRSIEASGALMPIRLSRCETSASFVSIARLSPIMP